jgi:hypothetical protein
MGKSSPCQNLIIKVLHKNEVVMQPKYTRVWRRVYNTLEQGEFPWKGSIFLCDFYGS